MKIFKRSTLFRLMTFYPPFIGAGIRVKKVSDDIREIIVEMKLRFWNKNYVGTHFGGSLAMMSDPFYMLMLIENLGKDYIVWDKEAHVNFKLPGRSKVTAHFKITQEDIDRIKREADENSKIYPKFTVEIKNEKGETVCEVIKTLYIAKKRREPPL